MTAETKTTDLEKLIHVLLYEGYVLYPYRSSSVKNRHRFTFGGLYPEPWTQAQQNNDPHLMQTQCLIEGPNPTVNISLRFLHLINRTVARLTPPIEKLDPNTDPKYEPVDNLEIDGKQYQSWQESEERSITINDTSLPTLLHSPLTKTFSYPPHRTLEPLTSQNQIPALLIREQQPITGSIQITAQKLSENLHQLTIQIQNQSPANPSSRDEALMHAFISTHTILHTPNAQFISLTDPPDLLRSPAANCKNIGAWPILVGTPPSRSTLLSSPIILADYPQLAPESPGNLFDSTEIDEILTLRILTLTDQEKQSANATDDHVRQLLARTESLARTQMASLHGITRPTPPQLTEEQTHAK